MWWFDPRTGNSYSAGKIKKANKIIEEAPTSGIGNDWVLVMDSKKYGPPGALNTTKNKHQ
ncbi:MAG: hypothetical protein COA50_07485 [Flavobacteriaceae bacterium]|nr:MAG: hypothetical protein COA50_07485 [Flavobacteriaceae bacterium]